MEVKRAPLRESALRRAVDLSHGLWREIRVVEETGSTNADMLAAAAAGAPEGLVIIAEHQTAGRGRLARTWQSPARAGLTFSVLLRPTGVEAARRGWLPLLAGVAVADALGRVAELSAMLKWPNDVLIGDRKVAGILAEASGSAVVVGIGVNVSHQSADLPVATATSLLIEGAVTVDRHPLLRAVLRELAVRYISWSAAGGGPDAGGLHHAYSGRCATIGRRVRIEMPAAQVLEGDATGVDPAGQLVVRTEAGQHVIGAGDVIHVR